MPDVAILATNQPTWVAAAGPIVLGAIGLLGLTRCRRRVAQTTLLAAWQWGMFGLVCVATVEVAACVAQLASAAWVAHARYAAAITTLAPQMAALGAKRPQHQAWQFVVVSLVCILLLPSAGSWLRPGAGAMATGPWRWFLLLLIALGWANHTATRFWPSSLLLALGQCCLLAGHLPLAPVTAGGSSSIAGLALGVAAIGLVALELPRARRCQRPLDRVWADFRDLYGMLWSLRLAERFNASARTSNWPVRLAWRGLQPTDPAAAVDGEIERAAHRGLRSLLRRFVSSDWITARLGAED